MKMNLATYNNCCKFFRSIAGISFCFILLCLTPNQSLAQSFNLSQFGIEEGLPQSSIYSMVQDKDGNIWVGTMNGISKYNGLNFKNYTKSDGIAEIRVTSSCLDRDGNVWFGHWSGGITKYDIATGKFSEVTPAQGSLSKTINSIFCDKKGQLWFGTEGEGVWILQAGQFKTLNTKNGLTGDAVSSFAQDQEGNVWIGTNNGVSISGSSLTAFSGAEGIVTALACDKKGELWIGTQNKGLVRVQTTPAGDKRIYSYTVQQGLASNYVKSIYETSDGILFVGTYWGGVSKFLPELEKLHYKGSWFQTISTKHGLSNDRVLSILQDRERNIWFGTYLGLNQYFDEQFEIFGENDGLQNTLIWSVIQSKDGDMWLGTENGLIQFVTDASKSIPGNEKAEPKKKGSKKAAEENDAPKTTFRFIRRTGGEGQVLNTTALYEDITGHLWFTNFAHGLSRMDIATGEIKEFTTENGLPVNEIYCINGDKDGNVWIGTNKGGALRFDITSETFEKFTVDNNLGSNQIYTIFHDSKDRMWFGALGGSLSMLESGSLSKGDKKFKRFSASDGYPGEYTLCMTEDSKGNMWFGSYEKGLYKYDGKTFRNYSTKEGLSSKTPFLLTCDNKDNIWVGTGLGIDKFNTKEETFRHYEKGDGFLGIEINPNASCKDKEGNLWFGSIIGVVKYNAALERTDIVEPVTSIGNPKIYFQEITIPEDHIFPWNKNHFTFEFTGTSLTNPKRVKYRYMLEGLDKEWSPIVKENSVTYPDLQKGDYIFKVRSCNSNGVWNKNPVTFHFSISPPFWRTTWFYVALGTILILSITFVVKRREKELKKKNQILEEKVQQRTEVITAQKSELEKKNSVIIDSIEYAKNIQQALLPADSDISKYFSSHFVLYKPKDIVSGDFYWIQEDHGRILLGVADCTGHGVPGAFMSLMGHSLLKETINVTRSARPAEILAELNIQVLKTLKQDQENASAKYGMDIALISVNKDLNSLEFAGAHNPLFLIRDGECTQIKGDKRSIGSFSRTNTGFTSHPMDLKKGDMLYMISDGYVDQIGGQEGKKFFGQPFRELLQNIYLLDVEKQKQVLDDTIMKWKGDRVQTDDILVVGIRI